MVENAIQPKEIDEKTAYRREVLKESIRIFSINFENGRCLDNIIMFKDEGNYVLARLKYSFMNIWETTIPKEKYNPFEFLRQLVIDVDAGKFDKCIDEALTLRNSKRKQSNPYTLKRNHKRYLTNYPNLYKAVRKYISDKGMTESGNTEDFVIFFNQVYHKYALKAKDMLLKIRSYAKIEKLDSSRDKTRCKVIENYIKNHFQDSVNAAIFLAEDYGDAEVDSEGNIIDKGIDYLTKKQKQELFKYPYLRKYVNTYIRHMDSYPNFSQYSDFTMFFKKQEFENCVSEEDMFPMWMDIDDRVQKQRENDDTTSDEEYNYYEEFNNSGSHSRWMVVEEFIASEFSYCVDCAIKIAEEYGDIDIDD